MALALKRLRTIAAHVSAATCAVTPSEQVVAISGCTSGLGLNLCLEFIRLGYKVAGCGRRQDRIDEMNKTHGSKGSAFFVVDTCDEQAVKRWSEEVVKQFGRVDVLCNNAGMMGDFILPWDVDGEVFSKVLTTNVLGVHYGCKHFIPLMLEDLKANPGRGVIKRVINTSSGVGHSSSPYQADYSASKWGVQAYSKSVAQGFQVLKDSAPDDATKAACGQILCVPLAPGVIATEMTAKLEGLTSADTWCRTAAPFIMSIPVSESGSSLTVPGFYGKEYMESWSIPNGLRLPAKWVMPK